MSYEQSLAKDTKRGVTSVTALFFLNGTLFGGWASRVPYIKDFFGLSPDDLSLILLMLAGGAITSFMIVGRWINRFGAQWVSKILVYAYCIATIAVGLSSTILFLVIALTTFGFMFGAMDVAMNAWGSDVEKHREKPIMSFFHAVFSIGAGLGAGIGALCLYLDLSIQLQFIITPLILGLMTLWVLGKTHKITPATSAEKKASVTLNGIIILLGLIAGASALGEGAMVDWSAIYLIEVYSIETEIAIIGFVIFSISMVGMRLSADFFILRFNRFSVLFAAACIGIIGTAMAVFGQNLLLAYIGYFLMGCAYAPVMPIAFSVAGNLPNISPGNAIAGVAIFAYGGTLLGPPLIGFTAHLTSFQMAFGILFILSIMSAALTIFIKSHLVSN